MSHPSNPSLHPGQVLRTRELYACRQTRPAWLIDLFKKGGSKSWRMVFSWLRNMADSGRFHPIWIHCFMRSSTAVLSW